MVSAVLANLGQWFRRCFFFLVFLFLALGPFCLQLGHSPEDDCLFDQGKVLPSKNPAMKFDESAVS